MKTGSWATYRGPGRIGISAGTPRGQPAGYRLYRTLAPDRAWMHRPIDTYRPLYEAILNRLDPQQVWDALHKLAGEDEAGQQIEPVILCFEKPPFTEVNFCHRRMAADWFEKNLGVIVPEVSFEQPGLI